MKVTVAPASTRTGRATINALLEDPSQPLVTGIYRDLSKAPPELKANPRFHAVQGDIADPDSLNFSGADVVVTATPPQLTADDPVSPARLWAQNVKQAVIKAASVRRLVYISSCGAQHSNGTGEIKTNHVAEQELSRSAPEIVFVRCAYFMENWASGLETLKGDSPFFYSVMSPSDFAISMVSTRDIGKACAAQAVSPSPLKVDPYIFDLQGPRTYSALDVKQAWEKALGREVQLKVVELDQLEEFFGHFLSPTMAEMFVEMTKSFHPGGILYTDPVDPASEIQTGSETLEHAIAQLVTQ